MYSIKHLIKNRSNLGLFTVLQHTLNDPASKLVIAHVKDFILEGVHNELDLIRRYLFDYFLHNVIPVRIFHTM
jgi:hypothetical protein